MPVAWPVRRLSSRQTHHLPIGLLDEPLDDVAPNDTERTDNDRLILHVLVVGSVCTCIHVMLPSTARAGPNDRRFELLPLFERSFDRQKIFNGLHLKSWTLGFVIDGKINANPETGTPNIFRRE